MNPVKKYIALKGSERPVIPGARYIGATDPQERIEISIYLRPRTDVGTTLRAQKAGQRRHIRREEYTALHGSHPEDMAQVEAFAHAHGLQVVAKDPTRRLVILAGTIAAMSSAFGVELGRYELRGRTYRGRVGPIRIPADLSDIIESVLGLDDRPQAQPRMRLRPQLDPAQGVAYTPPQVADLYNFPKEGDGASQCIGLIELGGGYVQSDLDIYFGELQLQTPNVSSVSVDGASNSPQDSDSSVEVMLDIEVAGTLAPGARIVVYFAPNSDRGFVDAITTAIFDNVNKPSVVSISWGGPEALWTSQSMLTMDQAFQSAAAVGVTICCASGDAGSSDGVNDGLAHADFPASSPFALACGGTTLLGSGGEINSETVWNETQSGNGATGGGISDVFDRPSWQSDANVPPSANPGSRVGRGIPDVAANADPLTGYRIRANGQEIVVGGTSAAAPLWAGLLALLNEQLSEPVGFLNPLLYEELINEADVVRDILTGSNGAYQAGRGWDACTGLGSPGGGEAWLAALIY
jgi:kumamolisin